MAKSHPTYNKPTQSNERTRVSFLMSHSADELCKNERWISFVQSCIDENGYAWQYNFSKDGHLSKRISLLYKKTR